MTNIRPILVDFDKAGAEWVVVAYLSGDAQMMEVCSKNLDPHARTGHLISGAPEDIIKKEHELTGSSTDPAFVEENRRKVEGILDGGFFLPRTMSIRQCAKKANHGLNYDMSYRRAALEWEMDENEAKRIVELYFNRAYPNIKIWHEYYIQAQLRNNRTLTNLFGRKYRFLDAWGQDLFKEAYAFIPQSTIFDLVRNAMVRLYNCKSKWAVQTEQLMQTHDNITTQYHFDGDWHKFAEMVTTIADDFLNPELHYKSRSFHIRTDCKIGFNARDMEKVKVSPDIEETIMSLQQAWEKTERVAEAAKTQRRKTA